MVEKDIGHPNALNLKVQRTGKKVGGVRLHQACLGRPQTRRHTHIGHPKALNLKVQRKRKKVGGVRLEQACFDISYNLQSQTGQC